MNIITKMKEEYETLLSNYDGALLYQEESRFNVFGMTYDGFMSKFVLKIPYKDHEIEVENEYGKANVGEVRMKLFDCKWVAFNIQTRNHLKRLFSFNKASFIVQSSQYDQKVFLEKLLCTSGMQKIEKDNLFEPYISLENDSNESVVITRYHLQFEDKIKALKAIIDFYIGLVNYR